MDINNKKSIGGKERETLKCWGCREAHLLRGFSHNPRSIQNIQVAHEATTVNDVSRNIPKISIVLEERYVEHQSTMIEMERTISNQCVSILID